ASGGPVFGSGELRDAQHSELSLGAELLLGKDEHHKVTASVYHHALDRTSPAVFPLVPPSIEATDFTRSRLGWSGTLHSGEHLRLAVGADLDREEGENRSLLFLPPFLGGDVPGDYRLVRTTPGAFAELLIERGDLLFEIGSRLDFPEDTSAQWSPRLGIRYQLGDDGSTRLRASAGRAFKLPSFFALASPPQLGGNPDLRPETSLGADLGIEHSFGGNADSRPIDAGLTLFYSRYENLVDFDFETFSHVNRSEVEARGVESYLTWRPDARFALRLNLTWQEVKNIGSDARLRHRPRWVGGLRLTWTPRPTLRFELSSQGVSESFDEQIPVTDRFTTSGYQLLALSGSWKLASSWELRGRVDNLADKNYETLIGFPGPGRALRLGLRYHLGGRQDP
ncbi:MAG: TonB-dependent receptor, partial [Acidobacteriota bacterium]